MTDLRALFSATIDATTPLLDDPALLERFDGPSALTEFSVRGLAGHLLRAMTSVEGYLDRPEPAGGETISAARYYASVLGEDGDIHSDLHRSVRRRGEEAAAGPAAEFPGRWRRTAAGLRARLAGAGAGRLVQVYGDHVLTLDDYLVTRIIELAVHGDDLAASLDVPAPPLPSAATGLAIATLVEVARLRHGDGAVLRALARRERDTAGALRVL